MTNQNQRSPKKQPDQQESIGQITTGRNTAGQPIIFVLWGEGGEEASAAIFVRELRVAGLCVKLVGLGSTKIKGGSGLVIVPDMTLGEALLVANQATFVILPFRGQTLRRFTNDPRLEQFINAAHSHDAIFIQSEEAAEAVSLNALFDPDAAYRVVDYPVGERLYGFVCGDLFSHG